VNLDQTLARTEHAARVRGIQCDVAAALSKHGDFERWRDAFDALPDLTPSVVELRSALRIGLAEDVDRPHGDPLRTCRLDLPSIQSNDPASAARDALVAALRALHPWRKGPISLFGVDIDTEWRSDWKWARVQPHISRLDGRRVLDVGCGNGYFGWRMVGDGARCVIGVDPSLVYFMQYLTIAGYLNGHAVAERNVVMPLRLEELSASITEFDTVFSMGVLYHRRDPRAHIDALRQRLRVDGELVLETLVVPGSLPLQPHDRYARMRNVFEIPDMGSLVRWLQQSGLRDIRVVDTTVTSGSEQRRTEWMTFDSLAEALDPRDPSLTVEGYPAPMRAIVLARR